MTYVSDADVKAGKYRGVEKLKRTTVVLSSVDSSTDNRYINFAAGQLPKGVVSCRSIPILRDSSE